MPGRLLPFGATQPGHTPPYVKNKNWPRIIVPKQEAGKGLWSPSNSRLSSFPKRRTSVQNLGLRTVPRAGLSPNSLCWPTPSLSAWSISCGAGGITGAAPACPHTQPSFSAPGRCKSFAEKALLFSIGKLCRTWKANRWGGRLRQERIQEHGRPVRRRRDCHAAAPCRHYHGISPL